MDSKLPAFQFYPADWRKDPGVQSLSYEDRGVWIEIICLMHESPRRGVLLMPNGAPMMSTSLARILGIPTPRLVKILDRIALAGVSSREEETEALVNRRMVKDEALRQIRAAGGELGAEHGAKGGEFGRLGGRPKRVLATGDTKPPLEPGLNPRPSSSPSSSSSTSKEKKHYSTFGNVLLSDAEFGKLSQKFGQDGTGQRIEELGEYVASKGVRYKSHYATLLMWERKNGSNGQSHGKETIAPFARPLLTPELQAEIEADLRRLKGEA